MDGEIGSQIRHFYEVERLTPRQIAENLGISRKAVYRRLSGLALSRPKRNLLIRPYERLIEEWYRQYPFLKAKQVLERLQGYGFPGKYTVVKEHTRQFRRKRGRAYHELEFLAGEEFQADWMQWTSPFGTVYCFALILSWSRYLYAKFHPRNSFEFFLDGHIEAFREMGGVTGRGRYDNLKSVVIKRSPKLVLNGQFVDFARHYGFSIYPCTPRRANEKGRIERAIRDINDYIRVNEFDNLEDLNRKLALWRVERNNRVHRSTGKPPALALEEEKLRPLPQIAYKPYRPVPAQVSTTGFVQFDMNRYSVPSEYSDASCRILAYPGHIEIVLKGKKITHTRSFEKGRKIENPAHRKKLLARTPNFKYQRIRQLMRNMDGSLKAFLDNCPGNPLENAYELFKLLKGTSKETLISAVRESVLMGFFSINNILNLFHSGCFDNPVRPQNSKLMNISYEGRPLDEYDELI